MSMDDDGSTIFPLVLNNTNLIPSIYNNVYRYTPPTGAFTFKKGSKVGIGSISIFYSWFNFSDIYGNNSFSIIFSGYGTLAINIGNQSLSISDLNSYVQQQMIQANLYLVNSSGENVYYFEIIENAANYSVQVNLFPVPSVLPVGWTNPGLPLSGFCPQFVVPSTNFQQVVGFTAGTYGSATSTVTESYTSSFTPQVSPVQSIQVGCSLLRNFYNSNPTILYSFTSAGTQFGSLIQTSPNFPQFSPIYPGNYTYIDVTLYDQNGNAISINDTNLTILLLLKVKDF
jgi:hypothetical protein